jgi:hypothetical protein
VPAPRDDEQHRLLGAQDQPGVAADPVARDDQVDALAGPDLELAALADQALGLVGPDAGGVDDLLGAHVDDASDSRSCTCAPVDPLALAEQPTTRARVATCAP